MNFIETPNAPAPAGHYSQAIGHGGLIFVSGQVPIDPETGNVAEGIEAQTARVMRNIEGILHAAGSDLDHLLKLTIFITKVEDWPTVNEVCAGILGNHKPARAVIPGATFARGFLIEADAVAIERS